MPITSGVEPFAFLKLFAYGPIMMIGVRTSWPARAFRLLMLILGIAGVPSVGPQALQRPHCAQHEMALHRMVNTAATLPVKRAQDAQAWTEGHDHDCPHCPASDCASLSPCAGSSTTAIATASAAVAKICGHRVAIYLARERPFSATTPPDTPPPQLIA